LCEIANGKRDCALVGIPEQSPQPPNFGNAIMLVNYRFVCFCFVFVFVLFFCVVSAFEEPKELWRPLDAHHPSPLLLCSLETTTDWTVLWLQAQFAVYGGSAVSGQLVVEVKKVGSINPGEACASVSLFFLLCSALF
jgi:hypothetical protein